MNQYCVLSKCVPDLSSIPLTPCPWTTLSWPRLDNRLARLVGLSVSLSELRRTASRMMEWCVARDIPTECECECECEREPEQEPELENKSAIEGSLPLAPPFRSRSRSRFRLASL
jgi:hypothetical protein